MFIFDFFPKWAMFFLVVLFSISEDILDFIGIDSDKAFWSYFIVWFIMLVIICLGLLLVYKLGRFLLKRYMKKTRSAVPISP